MRCPNCGSEVASSAMSCKTCGRPVPPQAKVPKQKTQAPPPPQAQKPKDSPAPGHVTKFTHADVAKKLKFDYMYGSKDNVDKVLSSLEPLFATYRKPKVRTHELLEEAADIIYRHLRMREISIGLRSPKDGLYRYEVMAGMRPKIWQAHEDLAYTKDDFFRNDKWIGTMISKYTKILLAEDNPYEKGEEGTVDRKEMVSSKRHNLDDSIEGDYLDIMMIGPGEDLVGWIEVSGTWTSKLPDPQTIRFIELMACTLGSMLSPNTTLSPQSR